MFCDILFDFHLICVRSFKVKCFAFFCIFEVAIEFRNVDKTHSIDQ